MSLDENTKRRICGIRDGTVQPVSGLEKHFRRVCLGEAIPVTSEERAWYAYVTSDGARESQEARARDELLKKMVAEVNEARLRSQQSYQEAERLQLIVDRQQRFIHSLQNEIQRLREHESVKPVVVESIEKDDIGNICHICNGDGGAKGECYKCGGTGWLK